MASRRLPNAGADRGIVLYGARMCEDTAITRSRLHALGIPYRYVDIDNDPGDLAEVLALEGCRVTPVVVIRSRTAVVAEPSIERLEALLRAHSHEFPQIRAHQVARPVADRAIPIVTLESADGQRFSLGQLNARRQVALLLAHNARCLACFGYTKQLAAQAEAMRDAEGIVVVAVRDQVEEAHRWEAELGLRVRILGDAGGRWSELVQSEVGGHGNEVALVLLDRWAAPRAVSIATEAGGLAAPSEAAAWLQFIGLECPECGADVSSPWLTQRYDERDGLRRGLS